MAKIIGRRLAQLVPTLFVITLLSFAMMRLAGSDVVAQKMQNTGTVLSAQAAEAAREELGLELVGEDEASAIVVNSCAVTGEALILSTIRLITKGLP